MRKLVDPVDLEPAVNRSSDHDETRLLRRPPGSAATQGQRSSSPSSDFVEDQVVRADVAMSDRLHGLLGNGVITSAALGPGGELGSFGGLVAADLAVGLAGVDAAMGRVGTSSSEVAQIMRRAQQGGAGGVGTSSSTLVERALSRSGQPLPEPLRQRLESAFGKDLGGVRVHTDSAAAMAADAVSAYAFTTGRDIVFNQGQYRPGTAEGDELIAHEVTHVVQHLEGRAGRASGVEGDVAVSTPGDATEREAVQTAADFVRGRLESPAAAPALEFASSMPFEVDGRDVDGLEAASVETPTADSGGQELAPAADLLMREQDPLASSEGSMDQEGLTTDEEIGEEEDEQLDGQEQEEGEDEEEVAGVGDEEEEEEEEEEEGKDEEKDEEKDEDGESDEDEDGEGDEEGDPNASDENQPTNLTPPPTDETNGNRTGGGGGGMSLSPTDVDVPLHGPVEPTPIRNLRTPSPPKADKKADEESKRRTGLTVRANFEKIVAEVNALSEQAERRQGEMLQLASGIESRMDAAVTTASGVVTSAGTTAEGRVTTAITEAKGRVESLSDTSLAQIQTSKESAQNLLQGAETTHLGTLNTTFTEAKAKVDAVKTEMREPLLKVVADQAVEVLKMGETKGKDAIAKGTELAAGFRAAGGDPLVRLANKAKAQAAETMGKQLGANMKPMAQQKAIEFGKQVVTAELLIANTLAPVYQSMAQKKAEADAQIKASVAQAKAKATGDGSSATTTLSELKTQGTAALETEQTTAVTAVRETTTSQADQVRRTGDGLKSTVRASATELSRVYDEKVAVLQGILDEASERPDYTAAEPQLREAREAIDAAFEEHKLSLDEQARNGEEQIRQVGSDAALAISQAADGRVTSARGIGDRWTGDIGARANAIEQGLATLSDTVQKQVEGFAAPLVEAARGAEATAREGLESARKGLETSLTEKVKAFGTELDGIIGKMPGEVEIAGEAAAEQAKKALEAKCTALFNAMDGMGTDEGAIFSALRGMDSVDAAALKVLYARKYRGKSLEAHLRDEMGGGDIDEALAHLSGNKVEATLASLKNSINWYGDDEAAIEAQLRTLSDADLAALKERCKNDPKAQAIIDRVRSNLGGADLDVADALMDQTIPQERRGLKADAIRVFDAMDGMGTDEDGVYGKLEGKSDEQRAILKEEYAKYSQVVGDRNAEALRSQYGDDVVNQLKKENANADHSLDAAIKKDFSGAEQDLALGLSAGDEIAVKAAKLEIGATGGWFFGAGTDEKKIFDTLEDPNLTKPDPSDPDYANKLAKHEKAVADRQKLNELYKEKYGRSIEEMITSEMGDPKTADNYESQLANQMLARGAGDRDLMVKAATDGIGTNEELLKKALDGLSKAEVADLRKKYADKYGGATDQLDRDLGIGQHAGWGSELSGIDQLEVEVLMLGKPETPEDFQKIADMQHEYQRSGLSGAWMDLMGTMGVSEAAEQLDWQKSNVDAAVTNMRQNPNDPAVRKELESVFGYYNDDFKTYEQSKNQVADAVTTGVAVAGLVAATVLTKGAAAPALAAYLGTSLTTAQVILAGAAAFGTGLTTMGAKSAMLGNSYGWEAMTVDGAKTLLDTGLAGLSKAKFMETWAEGVVKGMDSKSLQAILKGSLSSLPGDFAGALGGALMDEKAWDGDMVASQLLIGFITSQASGVVSGQVKTLLGDKSSLLGQMLVEAGVSVSGDVTGNLLNPATWKGDADDIFWKVMKSAGVAAGKSSISTFADQSVRAGGLAKGLQNGTIKPETVAEDFKHLTTAEKLWLAQNVDPSHFPASWRNEVMAFVLVKEMDSIDADAKGGPKTPTTEADSTTGPQTTAPPTKDGTDAASTGGDQALKTKAAADYDAAVAGGYKGKFTKAEFEERYAAGFHYDLSSNRWKKGPPPAATQGTPTTLNGKKVDLTSHQATDEDLQAFQAKYGSTRFADDLAVLAEVRKKHPELATMTDAELVALRGYTSHREDADGNKSDYYFMNKALREQNPDQLDAWGSYISSVSSGLSKLPAHEGTVYRGSTLPESVIANYKPGTTITEKSFFSTAVDPNKAFGGNVTYVIQSKRGRDIAPTSHFPESEVLFAPGTNFNVLKVEKGADGRVTIYMDEV